MLFSKLFTLVVLCVAGTTVAQADFHRWDINELFSNADGSIQFIEFFESEGSNGENLLFSSSDAALLSSISGSTTLSMSFPNDLPSTVTENKFFLIATAGFAGLAGLAGAVTPDYIMTDGFLFIGGGSVVYSDVDGPLDTVTHGALPIDGILSINAAGSTGTNSPTNFAGDMGSIDASTVVPVPAAVWLFTSGLLGLVGVARRRSSVR